jgi:hypothetical protein
VIRNASQDSVISDKKFYYTLIYEGEWRTGKRHGQGYEVFSDAATIYFG